MAVYNKCGEQLSAVYARDGSSLLTAYDKNGNEIFTSDGGEPFVKTYLHYDSNLILPNSSWITNATAQRDALIQQFQQSADAIPFFIQTDGHGNLNDGNKGCHNLAEPIMGYIANFQLGDWESYYRDGASAIRHKETSNGIAKYIPCMGNHEFDANDSDDAPIASLPVLVDSFISPNAIIGSGTYGYYKVLDNYKMVKYLVFQPHIPCEKTVNSSGFVFKIASDQWEWAIDEMEADDGYDIVIINHEPFMGTYTHRFTGITFNWNPVGWKINLTPVLMARKAKQSGSITDPDGVEHTYDFTGCQTDLLCALYGHMHEEQYAPKTVFGFPTYAGNLFDRSGNCCYGLIDRSNRKLIIYSFNKNTVNDTLVLDL